jgi:hypothetical protein
MHISNLMINSSGDMRIIDFGKVVLFDNKSDIELVQIKFGLLVDFYDKQNDYRLPLLDSCFLSESSESSKAVSISLTLKQKFKSYCEKVIHQLEIWRTVSPDQKPFIIFDLLTFIGLIDGIHKYKASASIQFGQLIKLLFGDDRADDRVDDDLTYIINLRSNINRFDNWLNPKKSLKRKLLIIVALLDNFLSNKRPQPEEVDGGRKRYSIKKRRKQTRKRRKIRTSRRNR